MSVDITQLNGNTEVTVQQARTMLDQGLQINLNEVAPEAVEVSLREYVPVTEQGADGQSRTRNKLVTTQHLIETSVPMKLFNRMVATQKRAQEQRRVWLAKTGAENQEPEDDPMLAWQLQQVFVIWRLTEPEMTLDRLEMGLDIAQVQGLFARFFARYLNLLRTAGNQ